MTKSGANMASPWQFPGNPVLAVLFMPWRNQGTLSEPSLMCGQFLQSTRLLTVGCSDSPRRSGTPTSDRLSSSRQKSAQPQQESSNPVQTEDDFEVSDLDSDMEPDQLLETYLNVKVRLFQVNPDLVTPSNPRSKSNKKARGSQKATAPSGGALKLQKKLQQIESDALFDQREADDKWASKRVELAREAPGRSKRLKETKQEDPATPAEPESGTINAADDIMAQAALTGDALAQDSDNDDGLLGGMFTAEPGESQSVGSNGVEDSGSVTIRDFGKTTGMNPRRVLEEACRARFVCSFLFRFHDGMLTLSSQRFRCSSYF